VGGDDTNGSGLTQNESQGILMDVGHVSRILLPLLLYMHPEDSANCLLTNAPTTFSIHGPGRKFVPTFTLIFLRAKLFSLF